MYVYWGYSPEILGDLLNLEALFSVLLKEMSGRHTLQKIIFDIATEADFEAAAMDVFNYQYEHTSAYRRYCDLLGRDPSQVSHLNQIPHLPIELYKSHKILSDAVEKEEVVFTSSGTTGSIPSKHYLADLSLYQKSFTTAFQQYYGAISDWTILALLPSYLERGGSSLVYMADQLIRASNQPESGFFLSDMDALISVLKRQEAAGKQTLLLGVSYALLDLVEAHQFQLKHTIVMETGGMKGRRKEMVRPELHALLKKGFGVEAIHSEYGMTELCSQAYSKGEGLFSCPPWMRVWTRDPEDPLTTVSNKSGGINIIDLANIDSCSFIATQDLGKVHGDGHFEILGRFDSSDIRGCNLMVL